MAAIAFVLTLRRRAQVEGDRDPLAFAILAAMASSEAAIGFRRLAH
jgi:hypothetical protein